MSQKKNNGRQSSIDLGDDDDDIDFGSEDDFDNMEAIENFSLAELFARGDRRREETYRRERQEREERRARTEENTVANAGAFIFFLSFGDVVGNILHCS